jgi:uncharacterized protein YggE
MDHRIITVKGVGHARVKPDQAEIEFSIVRTEKEFEKSVEKVSDSVEKLTQTIIDLGFDKAKLKTTDWNCEQVYADRRRRSRLGRSPESLEGYKTTHELKIEFDPAGKDITEIIGAMAGCPAKPEFRIRFTIKEPSDLGETILADAAKNARAKATVIAEAAGVKLGNPLKIEYDWSEYHFFSDTEFDSHNMLCRESEDGDFDASYALAARGHAMMEPEDIHLRDTVRFMWELVE